MTSKKKKKSKKNKKKNKKSKKKKSSKKGKKKAGKKKKKKKKSKKSKSDSTASDKESKLLFEDGSVVVPGDVLAEGMEYLPSNGTHRQEDKIVASRMGSLNVEGNVLKIIPLSARYFPKEDDMVVGEIIDIMSSGWRVDINGPYSAVLSLKDASFKYIKREEDLTKYFDLGELVATKITKVTTQNLVDVTMKGNNLRKLKGGRVVEVNPSKIPRLIGKRGSMVSMMKKATDCQIVIGQNGLVWLKGDVEMENLLIEVIKKVARETHISGLTEDVKDLLEEKTDKKLD